MVLGLFSSDDSSNACGNHHWGEWTERWDKLGTGVQRTHLTDPNESIPVLKIDVPEVRQCQHDGCTATQRKEWSSTYQVPISAVTSSPSDTRDLNTLLEAFEDFGEEIGHAIIRRSGDIYEQPGDDHEDLAVRMRDLGQAVIDWYGE